MRIAVTGATGFIGKRLTQRLVRQGHELICVGRRLSKLGILLEKTKPVYADIRDPSSLRGLLRREKPDIVFHCAALVSNRSLKELMSVNRDGTRNLFDACLKESVKRIVYLSSIAVISGNSRKPVTDEMPYSATNRYGESKIEAEKTALSYRDKGLKVCVIRPVMVYGENEPHLLGLISRLIKWRLLPVVGSGENKLQLVCVDNVVDVLMLAMTDEKAYEGTYIVADNEVMSVREFFRHIAKAQNAKPPFVISDKAVMLLELIPSIKKKLSFFKKDRTYSIERIKKNLGYTPRLSTYDELKKAVLSYEKRR